MSYEIKITDQQRFREGMARLIKLKIVKGTKKTKGNRK